LSGTTRYASIGAMRGQEQSRRDDMESLGYSLLHLLRGNLPWEGFTKNQLYRVFELKTITVPDELCLNFPAVFRSYFMIVMSLGSSIHNFVKTFFSSFNLISNQNIYF